MGHAVDGDVFPQAALAGGRRHANHGQQARIIIMTVSTGPTEAPPPSLAHDLLGLARHYLGRRRVLLRLAGLALAARLTLNWGWLTASGIAPILVSLLPCAAICGLGLSIHNRGDKSSSVGTPARDAR